MIGIIDYGMGNLHSVFNAVKKYDENCIISSDVQELEACDKLVLPGVGAFPDCMENLHNTKLFEPIKKWVLEDKKPILGICLGMQAMFESSEEKGFTLGFGFLKGKVIRMKEEGLRIPHIGWNQLEVNTEHPRAFLIEQKPYVYYVHSYYAHDYDPEDCIGYSYYGKSIIVPGLFNKDNIYASQFHPEKSGEDGLKILEYFIKEA